MLWSRWRGLDVRQVAELLQQFPVDNPSLSDLQGRLETIRNEATEAP
jgi:hypothetical protein